MEIDLLSNVRGNVQALRNMWSSKVQDEEKPSRPTSNPSQSHSKHQQLKSPKDIIPVLKVANEKTALPTATTNQSPITSSNHKVEIVQSVIKETMFLPSPPPPPATTFKQTSHSVATLRQSIIKMTPSGKMNPFSKDTKMNGVHRWHVTRHVFRSGLIFNRRRRASDSILPLLMKTHRAKQHSRADSVDSILSETPLEHFIDYLSEGKENDTNSLVIPKKIKRSASDTTNCIRRNKLDDLIFQYEMIFRHLKNYDQFISKYPAPASSPSSKQHPKSFDKERTISINETEDKFLAKTPITNRQTQSLSRNVGRTFSDFIMNDLFLSVLSEKPSNEQRRCTISDASSQTDLTEPIRDINGFPEPSPDSQVQSPEVERNSSIPNEEVNVVLNELDTVLDNSNQELPIKPNDEVNVIVLNSFVPIGEEIPSIQNPLMQRLFEGKKTAYIPDDLQMKSVRIPEEMMAAYEIAKKKCFFASETLIYTTKMLKINRRGYSEHIRILCLTTERLYNITKKDPHPKEVLLYKEILGVTCTPCKDGFICIHTKDSHEDRGDWLVVVDHPCEFITQLFMIMGRDNNDDHFLKIESKFKHCRRSYGESSSSDGSIEVRIADSFRIKKADFESMIIYTP